MTSCVYVTPAAALAWHKYAQTEEEGLPLKELLLMIAQLDFFYIQSVREYLGFVSDPWTP